MTAAAASGAVDPSDVYRLADLAGLEISESGDVKGAADLVERLKKAKPHLFTAPTPSAVGSGGGNSGRTPGGAIGADQIAGLRGEKWREFQARVERGELKIQ